MRLYRQAHTVYQTQYHIVWVARFRRRILTSGVASYLRTKCTGIAAESGPRGFSYPRLGLTKRLSNATSSCRERKTLDKRSLNYKEATPVRAWSFTQ